MTLLHFSLQLLEITSYYLKILQSHCSIGPRTIHAPFPQHQSFMDLKVIFNSCDDDFEVVRGEKRP